MGLFLEEEEEDTPSSYSRDVIEEKQSPIPSSLPCMIYGPMPPLPFHPPIDPESEIRQTGVMFNGPTRCRRCVNCIRTWQQYLIQVHRIIRPLRAIIHSS